MANFNHWTNPYDVFPLLGLWAGIIICAISQAVCFLGFILRLNWKKACQQVTMLIVILVKVSSKKQAELVSTIFPILELSLLFCCIVSFLLFLSLVLFWVHI